MLTSADPTKPVAPGKSTDAGKSDDAPVKAPNLTTDGLKLLGGRLVPSSSGKPAALLMYEGDNGDRFTLLMEPTTFASYSIEVGRQSFVLVDW